MSHLFLWLYSRTRSLVISGISKNVTFSFFSMVKIDFPIDIFNAFLNCCLVDSIYRSSLACSGVSNGLRPFLSLPVIVLPNLFIIPTYLIFSEIFRNDKHFV